MKTNELVSHVNRMTDEDFPSSMVIPFLNDGIAQINAECDAKYPFIAPDNNSEYPLPETWQRLLICTFAAGRVKENDSSQFEYKDFYNQFDAAMINFKAKYVIPDEYKTSTESADTDFSGSYWRWG